MTLLEWLIIILFYLAAYSLWAALEKRRERAPYRARKPRRAMKFTVLTLLLIGLGLAYNSADVQTFFQKPAATPSVDLMVEPTVELLTPQSSAKTQLAPQKSSLVSSQPKLNATLPNQSAQEINLLAPPLISLAVNAAPTRPQTFNLSFQSDPPGATLYLGGERVGVTPLDISVTAGQPLPYTLRTERGVPNYRLYHAYLGEVVPIQDTALSVWLERLNAQEVKALYQEARPQPRLQPQSQLQHISASTVRYEVATDCSEGLNLTYTDKEGRIMQERSRLSGWAYGFMPGAEQFLYLYAKSNCAAGYLQVQIVQDDRVLEDNRASGEGAIATVSRYWQD